MVVRPAALCSVRGPFQLHQFHVSVTVHGMDDDDYDDDAGVQQKGIIALHIRYKMVYRKIAL